MLRIAIIKQVQAGTPWRAAQSLDVIAILDQPAWAALVALIAECPVIHGALTASLEHQTHVIDAQAFSFITGNADITMVRELYRLTARTSWLSRLKPHGPFCSDGELPFERQSHLAERSVVEQASNHCDPVWHATGRIELGQWIHGIWRPVTSSLRHLYKPGTQRERGMTGEVRYGELFVSERRHYQQVDLSEGAGHFQRYLTTEPIGLDEIDRRKKSRLAK